MFNYVSACLQSPGRKVVSKAKSRKVRKKARKDRNRARKERKRARKIKSNRWRNAASNPDLSSCLLQGRSSRSGQRQAPHGCNRASRAWQQYRKEEMKEQAGLMFRLVPHEISHPRPSIGEDKCRNESDPTTRDIMSTPPHKSPQRTNAPTRSLPLSAHGGRVMPSTAASMSLTLPCVAGLLG